MVCNWETERERERETPGGWIAFDNITNLWQWAIMSSADILCDYPSIMKKVVFKRTEPNTKCIVFMNYA